MPLATQTDSVTDAHSIIPGRPVTDECNQDWNLLFAEADGDGLVFEVERALDTGDTQDRAFGNDSVDGRSADNQQPRLRTLRVVSSRQKWYGGNRQGSNYGFEMVSTFGVVAACLEMFWCYEDHQVVCASRRVLKLQTGTEVVMNCTRTARRL